MINVWAGDVTDEQLKTHPWAATIEYIMINRRNSDLRGILRKIAPNIRLFYLEEQNQFVLSLYTYIENVYTYDAPVEEFARMAGEEISPLAEDDIMTMAERLKKEARAEGKLEGKLEGELKAKLDVAKRMLDAGSELVFVTKVTGLSTEQIKSLQKNGVC